MPVARGVYNRPTSVSFLHIHLSLATAVVVCFRSVIFVQFVDRCSLFYVLFVEKIVPLCFVRFVHKWRRTSLSLEDPRCDTSWYDLYG